MTGVALLVSCPANDLLTSIQQKVQEAKGGQPVATPQFDPAPAADGTYTSSSDFTVAITCATSGAAIHYTTNGSTPTVSTTLYTAPIAVAGNGTTMTIEAIGTKAGMTDSVLAQGTYKVNYTQVSTPQFDPLEGTYTTDQSVAISTTTPGTTIYYTTDGSDPTTSAAKSTYSTAIAITGPSTTKTIKAYATKAGMADSTVGTATYTISYPTYTVSYNANGAGGTAPVDTNKYLPGQTVIVLNYGSLSKTGSYFIGWNTAADGSGTSRPAGSTFAIASTNVTLYAQWLGDLEASDGATNDNFGYSVAESSDGSTLVIGAWNKTVGANSGQGEAYVFAKSGISCSLTQELTASDGATGDDFGRSVAASSDGSTLVISAATKKIGSNTSQGAVYVFTKSGSSWSQKKELTADNGAASDNFGVRLAASSDCSTLVIGAWGKTIGSNASQGAAYVFTGSGSSWTQEKELTASDCAAGDYFGRSVAASSDGSTLLVGAPYKTIGSNGSQGEVYVFTGSGSTWTQQTPLTASDGSDNDFFGWSVAASSNGSTLVIGACSKTIGMNSEQGAAYMFTNSGSSWSQKQELTASDGATNDNFGYSVAESSDGSTLVIGAQGHSSGQGAVYVFTGSGGSWSQTRELTASDGATGDAFGNSVAESGDASSLVVGAYYKTIGSNSEQGAAYVF
jgi:hypothetical protein